LLFRVFRELQRRFTAFDRQALTALLVLIFREQAHPPLFPGVTPPKSATELLNIETSASASPPASARGGHLILGRSLDSHDFAQLHPSLLPIRISLIELRSPFLSLKVYFNLEIGTQSGSLRRCFPFRTLRTPFFPEDGFLAVPGGRDFFRARLLRCVSSHTETDAATPELCHVEAFEMLLFSAASVPTGLFASHPPGLKFFGL